MAESRVNQARAELADRIRALLVGDSPEQKRMFGSIAFLVGGRLLVAAWGEGDLLVRVDPECSPDLRVRHRARIAEMGPSRRTMGPSWLTVDAVEIADDDRLLFWIDVAREYHAGVERP
ncbi:MAG: TfoX/Sxy family protein [Microbacterium sp.]